MHDSVMELREGQAEAIKRLKGAIEVAHLNETRALLFRWVWNDQEQDIYEWSDAAVRRLDRSMTIAESDDAAFAMEEDDHEAVDEIRGYTQGLEEALDIVQSSFQR